jgi:hypothetical protein
MAFARLAEEAPEGGAQKQTQVLTAAALKAKQREIILELLAVGLFVVIDVVLLSYFAEAIYAVIAAQILWAIPVIVLGVAVGVAGDAYLSSVFKSLDLLAQRVEAGKSIELAQAQVQAQVEVDRLHGQLALAEQKLAVQAPAPVASIVAAAVSLQRLARCMPRSAEKRRVPDKASFFQEEPAAAASGAVDVQPAAAVTEPDQAAGTKL